MQGKEEVRVELIKEYLLFYSTVPCSQLTEPFLKTGLVHGWLGTVLSLLEHGGLGRLR